MLEEKFVSAQEDLSKKKFRNFISYLKTNWLGLEIKKIAIKSSEINRFNLKLKC